MENVIYSSAKTLTGLVSKGEVSAVELVEGCMSRIEEVNPKLNAVVQFCTNRAMEEAKAADESRARGESLGPLHGVPMTIKDSLDTQGVHQHGRDPWQGEVRARRGRDGGETASGGGSHPVGQDQHPRADPAR